MRALFLGGVAADTAAGIKDELPPGLDYDILPDPIDRARLAELAPDIDILVSNHWRADYPAAPNIRPWPKRSLTVPTPTPRPRAVARTNAA